MNPWQRARINSQHRTLPIYSTDKTDKESHKLPEFEIDGVKVTVNDSGQFMALINGRQVKTASLSTMKAKVKASHVGEINGRVDGLAGVPHGDVRYGYTQEQSFPIVGVTSKTDGRGAYRKTTPVYITKFADYTRERPAYDLVLPNPEAFAKLEALHQEYNEFERRYRTEAARILKEDYEHFSVDDVKAMLAGSVSPEEFAAMRAARQEVA